MTEVSVADTLTGRLPSPAAFAAAAGLCADDGCGDVSEEIAGLFCRGDGYSGVHDRAVLNRSQSFMFRCGLLCFFLA